MDETAKKFIERLSDLSKSMKDTDDVVGELYDAVDLLNSSNTIAEVFPAVFLLFEQFPAAGFGTPGPLVHLIEATPPGGYEVLLLDSLARKPVPHTIWMANRLLNSEDVADPLRGQLRQALKDTIDHPAANDAVKQQAADFLSLHV